jgi:hypothetical protein
MSVSMAQLMDAIRAKASASYQARIPLATKTGIAEVGNQLLAHDDLMNEWLNGLVDNFVTPFVKNRMFTNPLKALKKTAIPYGKTISEIYVNPAVGETYSTDGTKLLVQTKPDTKASYYYLNRKDDYPVTVNEPMLKRAWSNDTNMQEFVMWVIQSMYSGDEIDEFTLTKSVVGKAIDEGAMTKIEVPNIGDAGAPKAISKAISLASNEFTFPSDAMNGYNLVNKDKITAGEKSCITWCPIENQVLLIRNDIKTEINYEVLASAFNIDKVQIEAMTIIVNDFGLATTDVYAVLCDSEAIQIRDAVYKTTNQYIANTLEWNYWLHHWQWLYLSLFANAVAFCPPVVTP